MASYSFPPEIGGIETVSRLLASRWQERGHDVTVVTWTEAETTKCDAYRVVRRPGLLQMLALQRWADVHFQNNISLHIIWPAVVFKKPLFICHQTWLWHNKSRDDVMVRIKFLASRLACNIAISKPIAADLKLPALTFGNPYDEFQFYRINIEPRKDYLFVGRLVNDKGVDVFLKALSFIAKRGEKFTATVAGDGPARNGAVLLAGQLGIIDSVEFRGPLRDQDLADCYRDHRVLVVPSRWEEPFGIVALEGLASGCEVVAAKVGGLPEAVGPGGHLFPRDDWSALALILMKIGILGVRDRNPEVEKHLKNHSSQYLSERYLELFQEYR